MRTHLDFAGLQPDDRGASAAIGNFDGVHLGHQAVLDIARDWAQTQGAPLGVVTFEPHPREYFAPDAPPFRLMNAQAKSNRLAKLGVDQLYQLPFDTALAALSPDEFARNVIADGLALRHVVVGSDFCFGKGRAGTAEDLKTFGHDMGFEVTLAPLLTNGGRPVSSTAIRTALSEGRPRDAAEMLGHWHRIEGAVLHGDKRGRDLGFPTANMSIDRLHPPKLGIYAVLIDILSGPHQGSYKGAASVGIRPTFGGDVPNCETFIFDFEGDLYDSAVSVALVDYLRPEIAFTSIDGLVDQMAKDCDKARAILSAL